MFGVTRMRRLPPELVLRIGLAFQVVGSYGIAAAEFQDITEPVRYIDSRYGGFGLSWVSVWVLLFTVVVPTAPRRAIKAALLSVSAVPVMFRVGELTGNVLFHPGRAEFFFGLIFPYLLVVIMAYVGSRVVYGLGREVTEARQVGSYHLVELLGQGGMGEVWRARHRLLARPAAVKLVRAQVLGQSGPDRRGVIQARFEREAQVTAGLRSPHTIELYDFGVADDGTFYYVMELLDGFDLDTLVERFGPVPAERVVHLLRQVCHSLAEAHENGLIHRDLKPANVFVCRYGRDVDFVKVLDFGLVKARDGGTTADGTLTGDNVVGGTPAFMAPEQAVGDHAIDGKTDLYGVGCLAYWLLTGRLVFEGRTAVETMMQHVHTAPEPPSRRTELPIPPGLEAVVLACLAKAPADRPPSADVLRDMLGAVPLAEPWTDERARRWWAAHEPARAPTC
jgi:serine/threonine-protein kinase